MRGLYSKKEQPAIDLLANDMWAMGVILVYLLAAHNTFGVNMEDGINLVRKWRDDSRIQLSLACQNLAQWVRCLSDFAVNLLCVDCLHLLNVCVC